MIDLSRTVEDWPTFQQCTDSCVLASFGLALSRFDNTFSPERLFMSFVNYNKLTACCPRAYEGLATGLSARDQKYYGISGYEILDAHFESGIGDFEIARRVYHKSSTDAGDFNSLIHILKTTPSAAILSLHLDSNQVHSVALSSSSDGTVYLNDPGTSMKSSLPDPVSESLWTTQRSDPATRAIGEGRIVIPN